MASNPELDDDLDLAGASISAARRREAIQRLQVGLLGLFIMALLVSLASIVRDRATEAEQTTVSDNPEALTADSPEATAPKDPLADAGVVPDLPQESSQSAAQDQATNPAGSGAPTQP